MDSGLGQMSFVVGRTNFFDFGFRLDDRWLDWAMRFDCGSGLIMSRVEHDGGLGLGRRIAEKRRDERIVATLFDFKMKRRI